MCLLMGGFKSCGKNMAPPNRNFSLREMEDGGVVNFLDLIFALFRLFSFRTAKCSSIAHSELSNLQNSAISGF